MVLGFGDGLDGGPPVEVNAAEIDFGVRRIEVPAADGGPGAGGARAGGDAGHRQRDRDDVDHDRFGAAASPATVHGHLELEAALVEDLGRDAGLGMAAAFRKCGTR